MTLDEAESLKQKLEQILVQNTREGMKEMEVFVAPGVQQEFEAFRKMWRNSNYVVALATYGHADMTVYVCDENYLENDFEGIEQFSRRTGIIV